MRGSIHPGQSGQNIHLKNFRFVDYTHFSSMNNDHTYLTKSCTFIDCTLRNSFKHVHELVRWNLHTSIIIRDKNRSELGLDTIILYFILEQTFIPKIPSNSNFVCDHGELFCKMQYNCISYKF
jgi:hypothetical protein